MFNRNLNLSNTANYSTKKLLDLKERVNSCIISLNQALEKIQKTTNDKEMLKGTEKTRYIGEQFYFFIEYAIQNNIDPTDPKKAKPFQNIKEYCEEVDQFLIRNGFEI